MATQLENPPATGLMPLRVYLPVVILLGYIGFLVTGFGTKLGAFQPVPIYIFFGLLLLSLQVAISENHSAARLIYVVATSGFAIVYAAERMYNPSTGNFTRSPYTYIIINILLLVIFAYDAIDRRRAHPSGLDHAIAAHVTDGRPTGPISTLSYGAWATDFAGLAVIFFIAGGLLDLLGPQDLLTRLGLHHIGNGKPYIVVDLNSALHLHLNSPINLLQNLDLVIALFATAISLLLLVIIGALIIPEAQQAVPAPSTTYERSLGAILKVAFGQVMTSLRLVLGPLVWLVPAFSIAAFAQQVTEFLRYSARYSAASLLDLFNPFGKTSQAHAQQGVSTIALGLLAVVAVILAVVVVEENGRIISRAIKIVFQGGRVVALTWAFFLYSLAMLNAVVVLGGFTKAEPFQVGAPGLIALLIGIAFALFAPARPRAKAPVAATQPQPRIQGN